MDTAVRFALSLVLLAGVARADLDLTPRVEESQLDGAMLRQLVFNDGARRVTYAPPRKWDYSGSGSRFVLHPVGSAPAEAIISVSKLSLPETFDEVTTKRLSDEVLASVPRGATNVALLSQERNPLLIERKETFLVILNYDLTGGAYTRSVMFLNRENEQVRFQFTSSRSAFTPLQKAFLGSHYSWQNL